MSRYGQNAAIHSAHSFFRKPFNARSSAQVYATRIRWLIGTLICLVVILVSALGVLWSEFGRNESQNVVKTLEPSPSPNMVQMLVAAKRIEVGQELEDSLFEVQQLPKERVPQGALQLTDMHTLRGQFAKSLLYPGFPINFENISARPLAEDFDIPPGYRAISIAIDEVSSVSYKVRPNHRVDVLLSFTYQGQPAVIPIVETVKVVAVGLGNDQKSNTIGSKTATLLVTSEDARKIELAKQYGKLSLVRAGESEIPKGSTDSNPITFKGLFLPPETNAKSETRVDGKMMVTDPRTGVQRTYVLSNGTWKVEMP